MTLNRTLALTAALVLALATGSAIADDKDRGHRGSSRGHQSHSRDHGNGHSRDHGPSYGRDHHDGDAHRHGSFTFSFRGHGSSHYGDGRSSYDRHGHHGSYGHSRLSCGHAHGHCPTRTVRVCTRPGYWETQWVPPQTQICYDSCGRPYTTVICAGYWKKVWVEPCYETRTVSTCHSTGIY